MTHWTNYQNVLIPDLAPTEEPSQSINEIKSLLNSSNCFIARWTSHFDSDVYKSFYYVLCDEFIEVEDISSRSARKEIRLGLRNNRVTLISKEMMISHGYPIYLAALNSYETNTSVMSEESFKKMVSSFDETIDIFGIFYEEKLVGWSTVQQYSNYCIYKITKYDPAFLKYKISAALNYTRNQYYLQELKKDYVVNGTKNINHNTTVQDYLISKFNFKKVYCKLNIEYNWYVGAIVKLSYPFRSFIYNFKTGPLSKLATVLKHEEILRNQK